MEISKTIYNAYQDYIKPIGKTVVLETIKIVAANYLLKFVVLEVFRSLNKKKLSFQVVNKNVVSLPMREEIFFRLIFPVSIGLIEKTWNILVYRKKPSDRALFIQKTLRVHLSALLFGAYHTDLVNYLPNLGKYVFFNFWNSPQILIELPDRKESWRSNLLSFTWTYLSGVNYVYLSEKCNTISLGILCHGANNLIHQLVALERVRSGKAFFGMTLQQALLARINFYP